MSAMEGLNRALLAPITVALGRLGGELKAAWRLKLICAPCTIQGVEL